MSRKSPVGSVIATMPSAERSKQPTSSTGPNRFFTARTIRSREERSPSKCSTTSTRCSSTRGPAMRAVLGDVTDQDQGDVAQLGHPDQRGRDLLDLGDPAGDAVDVAGADRLDRVDDQQRRLHLLDVAEHGAEVGLRGEVELVLDAAGPVGAQAHLGGRLLAGEVEGAVT